MIRTRHIRGGLAAALLASIPLLGAAPISAGASSAPTVSGPVTGGNGAVVLQASAFDLSTVGYTQSEFFVAGTATSYAPSAPLGSDGRWQVAAAGTAPYTTRIVVNRPTNPADFNGKVVVEWLNVSGGLDVAPSWVSVHTELIREGYAWVGVSAQAVGVNATKAADPVRYASLSHPGDSYSYDIFSQVGQVVRGQAGAVLPGLAPPSVVLAEGESQSAFRLTTYYNAIQPLAKLYDGFLVHSRAGDSAPLSQAPQANVPAPQVVRFRTDLRAPVLTVEAETDLITLGYLPARQSDSYTFRLWELAGAAHADYYLAQLGFADDGSGQIGVAYFNSMLNPPTSVVGFTCNSPINTGQMHYSMNAAQAALTRWVTQGIPPTGAPRLQMDTSGPTPAFVLDAHGNVKGGVRTPAVDVPVATLSGLGQVGSQFCFLFGTTTPFSKAKLAQLYPSHLLFTTRWSASVAALTGAGFLRPADAAELITAAQQSSVGS